MNNDLRTETRSLTVPVLMLIGLILAFVLFRMSPFGNEWMIKTICTQSSTDWACTASQINAVRLDARAEALKRSAAAKEQELASIGDCVPAPNVVDGKSDGKREGDRIIEASLDGAPELTSKLKTCAKPTISCPVGVDAVTTSKCPVPYSQEEGYELITTKHELHNGTCQTTVSRDQSNCKQKSVLVNVADGVLDGIKK